RTSPSHGGNAGSNPAGGTEERLGLTRTGPFLRPGSGAWLRVVGARGRQSCCRSAQACADRQRRCRPGVDVPTSAELRVVALDERLRAELVVVDGGGGAARHVAAVGGADAGRRGLVRRRTRRRPADGVTP